MTVLKAAVLLLLLSCLPLRAQKKPAPASVTLRFGNHSVEVALREDDFEVPPDIVKAEKVTFAADVEGDPIEIPGIAGGFFRWEAWTLLLAERRYDRSTQSGIPKGSNRLSGVLMFDSAQADPGQAMFITPSRSKRRP